MGEKSNKFVEEELIDLVTYDWSNNVLNGIAHMESDDTFIITGKMWHFAHKVSLDYREAIVEFEIRK
jgi:glutamine cyclotransferase